MPNQITDPTQLIDFKGSVERILTLCQKLGFRGDLTTAENYHNEDDYLWSPFEHDDLPELHYNKSIRVTGRYRFKIGLRNWELASFWLDTDNGWCDWSAELHCIDPKNSQVISIPLDALITREF